MAHQRELGGFSRPVYSFYYDEFALITIGREQRHRVTTAAQSLNCCGNAYYSFYMPRYAAVDIGSNSLRMEAAEIVPAVEECRLTGEIDVQGPFSADTVFLRASRGEFDAVIACYHDQAMIPVKCLSFGEAVNVTLGLPFIRTSVDHGTAFDIAGKGVAEHSSMVAAIKLAAELSTQAGESCRAVEV